MTDDEILNQLFYKKYIYSYNELYKRAKEINPLIKTKFIKEWHSKQQAIQQTTKKIKSKKDFLPIYSETPHAYQLDLTFFPKYKKQNKGFEVLFTAININTRFAFAYACKSKEIINILEAMKKMASKTEINTITCDKGSEYINKEFKKFCDKHDIELYYVKDDSHKMGIINRFHRTLKEKLTQYFVANNTVNWVEVIDDIVENYNHSVNRGIGIEPYKVNDFMEQRIIEKMREKTASIILKNNESFNIGDFCRILTKQILFEDKMLPKYSNKVFEIIKISQNSVTVKDSEDDEYKVKKSEIKLVDKDTKTNNKVFDEQKIAIKENKIVKSDKKLDNKQENIIVEKREKKKNKLFYNEDYVSK